MADCGPAVVAALESKRQEISDVLRIVAKLPNVAPSVQLVLTKRAQEI